MVDVAVAYFQKLWTEGNENQVDEILDPNFELHDMIWGNGHVIAGPAAMRGYVR